MPHSISPESTPADESSREMSQAEDVKPEPDTQDATMEDAPSPPTTAADKPKVNLEELFDDDDDSDGEFASSAPVKSEEEASQPAPLYAA
jgi:DNA primase small subunit